MIRLRSLSVSSGNAASNIVSGYVWLRDSSGGVMPVEPRPEPQPEVPLPVGTVLAGAAPNPFNPSTTLRFRAEAGETAGLVVYDLTGRRLRDLFTGPATGDWQSVVWNGRDGAGRACASGVYLVRLETETAVRTQRVVLAK